MTEPPTTTRRAYATAQDVATHIGASLNTVYAKAAAGEIPVAFKVGPRLRFDLDAVVEALRKGQP